MKLFVLLLFFTSKVYAKTEVFEALAKSEGQVVYLERHTEEYEGKSLLKAVTEFFDPNGKLIGLLTANFSPSFSAPEYIFYDYRHKTSQGLFWDRNNPETFTQVDRRIRSLIRPALSTGKGFLVSGPGLQYFLANNLDQISSKGSLEFQYIIPGQLEVLNFAVKAIASNPVMVELEVQMKSWVMRFFGPRMRFVYDISKKQIIYYEGQSSIRDKDGKMVGVDIEYKY